MKVFGDDFVELSMNDTDTKNNNIQEILNGNVPDDTLKRCTNKLSPSILTGIAELTESLYLCSAVALTTPSVLTALGVSCVINAAAELPDTPLPDDTIAYYRIRVLDRANVDLTTHLDAVADLIEQVRKSGGKTLVHCVAGVSRSATLCLAYLIKQKRMSLLQAFQHVKSKRPQIKPNNGFVRQLIDFERTVHGQTSVQMVYNEYVNAHIPDIYVCDYQKMIWFEKTYNRNFGRH